MADLPCWNLADLYASPECPDLQRDLDRLRAEGGAFHDRYAGKIAALSGAGLGQAIAAYERLRDGLGRIGSYASLLNSADRSDAVIARFNQSIQEQVNAISAALLFLTLEINRLEDADLAAKLDARDLARYQPWLRDLRSYRPHQLSDEVERLLYEKYLTGRAAWGRLFDETLARLRFPIGGADLDLTRALDLLYKPDPAIRQAAAEAIAVGLGGAAPMMALITNTLAKDKEIEDRWRGFARPISERNLSNGVEDAVVDALLSTVQASYPDLSHRYYRLKARWLGQERLNYWDRNAPLPGADDRVISWDEARDLVLDAYRAFSPEMAEIGARFFAEGWIDAALRPGKAQGAFAHPTVPSVHPYLLVNFQGRTRDVMTLAHELGHGVHQILAGGQGLLQAETPLTLAETASVFGEMLVFRRLADQAGPAQRKHMLASKVEDMINTVIRQSAFAEFERRVHDERRGGELLADRIGEIWLDIQRDSLGDAFEFAPGYQHYWSYISHFIHSPFYVYAYAFGDCLVNSLYATYQAAPDGFAERYMALLRAGGTQRHGELLRPFGLNAAEPSFWAKGLSLLGGFIDELEAMG